MIALRISEGVAAEMNEAIANERSAGAL